MRRTMLFRLWQRSKLEKLERSLPVWKGVGQGLRGLLKAVASISTAVVAVQATCYCRCLSPAPKGEHVVLQSCNSFFSRKIFLLLFPHPPPSLTLLFLVFPSFLKTNALGDKTVTISPLLLATCYTRIISVSIYYIIEQASYGARWISLFFKVENRVNVVLLCSITYHSEYFAACVK